MNDNKKNILLLSSDPALNSAIEEQLGKEDAIKNIEVHEEISDMPLHSFDLIILNEERWCSDLHTKAPEIPLILIHKKNSPYADILVQPPFRMGFLLQKTSEALNMSAKSLQIGPYILNLQEKVLMTSEPFSKIALTDKEIDLLTLMSQHKNTFISRETLLEKVWQYNEAVTSHTLETHIYRLRQKIEESPDKPQILLTEEGGYLLKIP